MSVNTVDEHSLLTREELEAEGHVFSNMQGPDSSYWEWFAKEKRISNIDDSLMTVASDGSLTRVVDLQEGAKAKIDHLRARAVDRPEWMKITDRLNSGREARLEELKESRPDLYKLRQSYILREDQ